MLADELHITAAAARVARKAGATRLDASVTVLLDTTGLQLASLRGVVDTIPDDGATWHEQWRHGRRDGQPNDADDEGNDGWRSDDGGRAPG